MPIQILLVFVGCLAIYASLFSIGSFVYGQPAAGSGMAFLALVGTYILFKSYGKLRAD